MSLFDTGHVAQLHEIQRSRLKSGQPGIGLEVEELIARLTSGGVAGKAVDDRTRFAKVLWDLGFGRELKIKTFKAYLATIPEIPESLLGHDDDLPLLSLADPRLGLVVACRLIGIKHEDFGYKEGDAVPFDDRFKDSVTPFWFRHDDGRKNRNERPDSCREANTGDTLVGTAMVGIMAYVHHKEIIREGEHVIDLPGSVGRQNRGGCAYLKVWDGQVELDLSRNADSASPNCGSMRVRRK